MRNQIREWLSRAYQRHWIGLFDGNISYRDASQSYFFISPTGVRKDFLYLDEVLRVHMPTQYATVREACEQKIGRAHV